MIEEHIVEVHFNHSHTRLDAHSDLIIYARKDNTSKQIRAAREWVVAAKATKPAVQLHTSSESRAALHGHRHGGVREVGRLGSANPRHDVDKAGQVRRAMVAAHGRGGSARAAAPPRRRRHRAVLQPAQRSG